MAILGDTSITKLTMLNEIVTSKLYVPTSSGGTTLGPGTNGYVLKTNGSTVYWGASGSISAKGSATQPVYFSGTDTVAACTYYLKATLNAGTTKNLAFYSGTNAVSATAYAHINYSAGTTSTVGYEELVLGSTISSGTANNALGRLCLHSSKSKGTYLVSADNDTSEWYTATLQAKTGTIAYLSDIISHTHPISLTSDINSVNPSVTISGGAYTFTGTSASVDGTATTSTISVLSSAKTAGTAPSLTYTSRSIPNVTSVGSVPTWTKSANPSLGTKIYSMTWSAGTTPTLGTAISADDITAWNAGAMPTYNTATVAIGTHTHSYKPSGSVSVGTNPKATVTGTHTHSISGNTGNN